ncbi:MAG: TPR end-of-group domain-containing protein [Bryobacteraceae bacterium]
MERNAQSATALSALERTIGSKTFARAERHRSLLRHLVEKTVAGRAGEIKESTIALEVFGRDAYDPQVDAQARVEVGKLRERLERYYATEGSGETVRIEIPKGSYTPVFRAVTAGPLTEAAVTPQPARLPNARVLGWVVAAVVLAAGVVVAIWNPSRSTGPADRTSIAVLPFEDLSPTKDLDYLCSGITDELIGDLASLHVFRVLPRSSVTQYKARPTDARKIGQQLNVHAVVEGTVRKENNRIRIQVQVVETRQGLLLWQAAYDRDFGKVLEIQREIAEATATAFNRQLFYTARALLRQRTQNSEAYDHYLRATYYYANDASRSIPHYRASIAADPGYALAWAGLAAGWIRIGEYEIASPLKARQEGMTAAAKAVSLDPKLAEAQWVLGVAKLYYEHDWRAAEKALLKAIELDRMYGRFRWEHARLILIPTGRFRECVDQVQEALSLEPANPILYNLVANCYIKGRQYREALPPLEKSRTFAPRALSAVVLQGMAAAGQGDYEQALRRFEEAAAIRRSTWVLGHLGFTLARLGRSGDARMIVAELELRGKHAFLPHYDLAVVYDALGEKQRAIDMLERALAEFSPLIPWINVDYRLDDLRDEPRFGRLVEKVGLSRASRN